MNTTTPRRHAPRETSSQGLRAPGHSLLRAWRVASLLALASATVMGLGSVAAQDVRPVIGWGDDERGQTDVPGDLTDVTAISAGTFHSLALERDGSVVAWGDDEFGQTDVPNGLRDVIAISAYGYHNLALRRDGTVLAWGRSFEEQTAVPAGLSDVIAISAGLHSLALKRDGTVVPWGRDDVGPVPYPPTDLSDVAAISMGGTFGLAQKRDGTFVGWGRNTRGQLEPPDGMSDVVAFDAGWNHTLALTRDGHVVAWGENEAGQTNVPDAAQGAVAVVADANQSLAIKRDGTIVAWGAYYEGGPVSVPAGLTNVRALAGGARHTLALVGRRDACPPTLRLPKLVLARAQSEHGAQVPFAASAVDDVDTHLTVACSPPSGSTFAVGVTTVRCSARDRAGNAAVGSFKVLVFPTWWWWIGR